MLNDKIKKKNILKKSIVPMDNTLWGGEQLFPRLN
jgi:hypothetical protein